MSKFQPNLKLLLIFREFGILKFVLIQIYNFAYNYLIIAKEFHYHVNSMLKLKYFK